MAQSSVRWSDDDQVDSTNPTVTAFDNSHVAQFIRLIAGISC